MTDGDWPFDLVLVGTPNWSSLLCEDLGSDLVTLVTVFVPSLATKFKVDGQNVLGEGLNQQKQHAKALDFRVLLSIVAGFMHRSKLRKGWEGTDHPDLR